MSSTVQVQLFSSRLYETGSVSVVISVLDTDLETVAGPESFFVSENPSFTVDPGAYVVHVDPPSGRRMKKIVRVLEGEQATAGFFLEELSGHETLEKTALLRGVDRRAGSPGLEGDEYASAWARLWRREPSGEWRLAPFTPSTAWDDRDGVRYEFRGLPSAPHVVQIGGPEVAWRCVAVPAHEQVTITVLPDREFSGEVLVSPITGDDVAESLLGYLQSGYIGHADALLSKAEDLLFGNNENPIAATISGYFLLRVRRFDRLHSGTLSPTRFAWLPDGPVIDGWQHLHAGKDSGSDAEFDRAREQFLLAASRGVPIYTEGLRLLIDGLSLFATPGDQLVQDALTALRRYADVVDWAAVTVNFEGVDPTRPDPVPRYGVAPSTAGMVFLHRVKLADLVRAGFLAPDTTVQFAQTPRVTGTVTEHGLLRLYTGATFADPDEAARSVWPTPSLGWRDWQLDPQQSLGTIALAARSGSVRAKASDPVERLGLSTRTTGALRSAGFSHVDDVIRRYDALADVTGIGRQSMLEIASSFTASELNFAAIEFQITLAWGTQPSDLDAHLSGPNPTGGRFHCFFRNPTPVAFIELDADDTTGNGRETITIRRSAAGVFVAGDYHYWVHNYSGTTFAGSLAAVTVSAVDTRADLSQKARYEVASATGDVTDELWHVFNLTIDTNGIIILNDVQTFQAGGPDTVL
jgi:Bacterial RNA polymerase, alpha chain C terminal domain